METFAPVLNVYLNKGIICHNIIIYLIVDPIFINYKRSFKANLRVLYHNA